MVFTKVALQLVSKEGRKKVQNIIQLSSHTSSDAGELCRHVKQVDDYERILGESRGYELAGKGFAKEIVKSGSRSLVFEAVLYRNDVVAVSQRKMAMSLLRDLFSAYNMFRKEQGILLVRCTERRQKKAVRESEGVQKH